MTFSSLISIHYFDLWFYLVTYIFVHLSTLLRSIVTSLRVQFLIYSSVMGRKCGFNFQWYFSTHICYIPQSFVWTSWPPITQNSWITGLDFVSSFILKFFFSNRSVLFLMFPVLPTPILFVISLRLLVPWSGTIYDLLVRYFYTVYRQSASFGTYTKDETSLFIYRPKFSSRSYVESLSITNKSFDLSSETILPLIVFTPNKPLGQPFCPFLYLIPPITLLDYKDTIRKMEIIG